MLQSFRGSPIISSITGIFLLAGPMAMAVRGELIQKKESIFNQPITQIIVPQNIMIYFVSLVILHTIRHVEQVIGTLKVFITISISLILDFTTRTVLDMFFGFGINLSGPFSLLITLACLYCIFFPTFRSGLVYLNEKTLMFISLAVVGAIYNILVVIPIICGFVAFALTSPFSLPDEKEKDD
ncbi:hypothetical protein TRFO_13219 [Tritrichomonas foetus]|uniref:Uncharacterized protein n=1 Tax=Tritrichomonas foetus TaxID=1144522 RepID=A0A1J4L345_9EUKA|nr:hypothetical protein TRFO_13219 [Tritrichomonas foetus]|eukprot:OHT16374.1 hypothetical protein TRFO_13219 [Tritrichomonas foetus]